jgi:hypothetical protein
MAILGLSLIKGSLARTLGTWYCSIQHFLHPRRQQFWQIWAMFVRPTKALGVILVQIPPIDMRRQLIEV